MTSDAALILRARGGDQLAHQRLAERHHDLIRLKASSYFLLGGESDDLIQEGLLGLYKAIRDYRTDRESSFRNFAELCITRQIITAVKTATRNKHTPLNQYVSFSQTPAASGDSETTLDEILPGPTVFDPVNQVIATEELEAFKGAIAKLSTLERDVFQRIYEGDTYTEIASSLAIDKKAVDNAVQRVRGKIGKALLPEGQRWRSSEPPIRERVPVYLRDHPDSSATDIARNLRVNYANVHIALHNMGDQGQAISRPDGSRRLWRLVETDERAAA